MTMFKTTVEVPTSETPTRYHEGDIWALNGNADEAYMPVRVVMKPHGPVLQVVWQSKCSGHKPADSHWGLDSTVKDTLVWRYPDSKPIMREGTPTRTEIRHRYPVGHIFHGSALIVGRKILAVEVLPKMTSQAVYRLSPLTPNGPENLVNLRIIDDDRGLQEIELYEALK